MGGEAEVACLDGGGGIWLRIDVTNGGGRRHNTCTYIFFFPLGAVDGACYRDVSEIASALAS